MRKVPRFFLGTFFIHSEKTSLPPSATDDPLFFACHRKLRAQRLFTPLRKRVKGESGANAATHYQLFVISPSEQ